jgi:hypothetical protein
MKSAVGAGFITTWIVLVAVQLSDVVIVNVTGYVPPCA